MDTITLKVASKSNPSTVAGAIANNIRDSKQVEIMVMGPNSVNQAVKALAIARGFMQKEGKDLHCKPEFKHLTIDGEERSAIKLVIGEEAYDGPIPEDRPRRGDSQAVPGEDDSSAASEENTLPQDSDSPANDAVSTEDSPPDDTPAL
jgi:stage V sporulation protein S